MLPLQVLADVRRNCRTKLAIRRKDVKIGYLTIDCIRHKLTLLQSRNDYHAIFVVLRCFLQDMSWARFRTSHDSINLSWVYAAIDKQRAFPMIKLLFVKKYLVLNDIIRCNYHMLILLFCIGYVKMVEFLIHNGFDVVAHSRSTHHNYSDAILEACENGHLPILKLLVRHGLHFVDIPSQAICAFRHAGEYGHLHVLQYLMRNGLTAHDVKKEVAYVLYQASKRGWIKIVSFLIRRGLIIHDVNWTLNWGFETAVQNKQWQIVTFMMRKNLTISELLSFDAQTINNAADCNILDSRCFFQNNIKLSL